MTKEAWGELQPERWVSAERADQAKRLALYVEIFCVVVGLRLMILSFEQMYHVTRDVLFMINEDDYGPRPNYHLRMSLREQAVRIGSFGAALFFVGRRMWPLRLIFGFISSGGVVYTQYWFFVKNKVQWRRSPEYGLIAGIGFITFLVAPIGLALVHLAHYALFSRYGVVRVALRFALVVLAVASLLWVLMPQDADSYFVTVLGERNDFCAAEGLRDGYGALRPPFNWNDYVPRKFLAWYNGRSCGTPDQISFYDWRTRKLLVAAECPASMAPDGPPPRVVIENPIYSDLGLDPARTILDPAHIRKPLLAAGKFWALRLKEKYGAVPANDTRYKVRRSPNGSIKRVSLLPDAATELRGPRGSALPYREPTSPEEAAARAQWGDRFFELDLPTEAVSVVCGTHEEYHVHPVPTPASPLGARLAPPPAAANATVKEAPPFNLLIINTDALSRQEFVRSLPKTVKWLRAARERLRETHAVTELKSITTTGFNTQFNFVPFISGMGKPTDGLRGATTLMNRIKLRFGRNISVTSTYGICSDFFGMYLAKPFGTTGFGDATPDFLDREMFGPFCHLAHGAVAEDDLKGPFSFRLRCLGGRLVHQHAMAYQEEVLRSDLAENRSFFNLVHLLEAHEASLSVVQLIDDDLSAYLERIEKEHRFFENPRNLLIIFSDHGNHMTPQQQFDVSGALERTTPYSLWFLPRPLMEELDARQGRQRGESLRNFQMNAGRLLTHKDEHLSLCELYGLGPPPQLDLSLSTSLFSYSAARRIARPSCAELGAQTDCSLSYCPLL